MFLNQIQNNIICGQITFICNLPHYGFIREIIIIVMIMPDIKKPVSLEPERLMDLKI
jgi:hypothetical protein